MQKSPEEFFLQACAPRDAPDSKRSEREALSIIKMLRRFMRLFGSDLEKSFCRVEDRIRAHLKPNNYPKLWIHHYGAIDIHPRHLVICIVVQTDAEAEEVEGDLDIGVITPIGLEATPAAPGTPHLKRKRCA